MNKRMDLEKLDYLEKCLQHYAHNPTDPEFGFFAFCVAPDILEQVRWHLKPAHLKILDLIRGAAQRIRWKLGFEPELPF